MSEDLTTSKLLTRGQKYRAKYKEKLKIKDYEYYQVHGERIKL